MLRAMWTGTISFGLVAIPVKAIPAQSSRDLSFELLHGECGTKLETRRYCPKCEREVPSEETVRGYQYSKGRYVHFTQEELEQAAPASRHTLRILDFVDLAEIDPVYYEKPYYLQPGTGAERTYALLHRAMTERGRVGIGKVAFRNREHLAVVRPMQHALVLEIISFPDEVRALTDAVPPLDVELDARELQMADVLVESMTSRFEPEKYRDEYREQLEQRIAEKVNGDAAEPAPSKAPARRGEVVDLMEVLRKSVAAAKEGRDPEPRVEKAEDPEKEAPRAPAAKSEDAAPARRAAVKPRRRPREKAAA